MKNDHILRHPEGCIKMRHVFLLQRAPLHFQLHLSSRYLPEISCLFPPKRVHATLLLTSIPSLELPIISIMDDTIAGLLALAIIFSLFMLLVCSLWGSAKNIFGSPRIWFRREIDEKMKVRYSLSCRD